MITNLLCPSATYLVDRFLYTYDLACRKDSTSNEYCDEIFHDALASGTWPLPNWDCSDCNLGAMQLQLSSPFGYDAEFADDFTSTTSSCTEAGYAYTSPAAYAISANPAPAPETPTCQSPYVVQANDTCDSISLQLNVSTHAIIRAGSLNPQCSNLRVGSSLCLPGSCTLYQVAFDETCDTILAQHPGLDWISLRLWNPNINPLCNNIGRFAQSYICVSPPGAEPGQGTPITTQPPTPTYDPPTAVPMPPNGKAESIYPCSKWYTIQSGDYCERISLAQGIALLDFYYLNPSIDSGCTNLWLDTAYCVGAVGDINTYPAYPYSTSLPYSLTSATYTTTTQTTTSIAPSLTPVVPLPLAAGSQSDCAEYFEHMPVEPRLDQHQQPQVPVITESINSCGFVANLFDVTHDDLLAWNPSLASLDSCMLQPGFRYCALHNTSSGGRTFLFLCTRCTWKLTCSQPRQCPTTAAFKTRGRPSPASPTIPLATATPLLRVARLAPFSVRTWPSCPTLLSRSSHHGIRGSPPTATRSSLMASMMAIRALSAWVPATDPVRPAVPCCRHLQHLLPQHRRRRSSPHRHPLSLALSRDARSTTSLLTVTAAGPLRISTALIFKTFMTGTPRVSLPSKDASE